MVARFEEIDATVPIASTPTDGLILAELLISSKGIGDVVECGCYAGGSTAKLSIVAKALGKRVFVFDSFEGLPPVDDQNIRDVHARRAESWVTDWTAGRGDVPFAAEVGESGRLLCTPILSSDVATFLRGAGRDELMKRVGQRGHLAKPAHATKLLFCLEDR